MTDVGDRLTRQRIRDAIFEAELAFGLAQDCDELVDAMFEHLGPYSDLAILRRMLAQTIDIKG